MMELANKVLSFLSWVTTFVSYLEAHLEGWVGSSASAVGALPGARGEKNEKKYVDQEVGTCYVCLQHVRKPISVYRQTGPKIVTGVPYIYITYGTPSSHN